MIGAVGSISWDVSEEGLFGCDGIVDEIDGGIEIDIRAVAVGLHLDIVVEEDGIRISTTIFPWL